LKFLLIIGLSILCYGCFEIFAKKANTSSNPPVSSDSLKIGGLTFVAPPKSFSGNPMNEINSIGANWIAVIPYGFTMLGKPEVHYKEFGGQWWGEKPEGIRKTIQLAHDAGLKVMLKPQVYVPGSWTGSLSFEKKEDWEKWESSYISYLDKMLIIANELKVEMFCIGTEFSMSTSQRPEFWHQLIKKIKTEYDGKLTYSSNWDNFEKIPFWKELDYIGVSAYFSIAEGKTPKTDDLIKGWKSHFNKLKSVSDSIKKPVLFTEYGYLSVDGCAWKGWEVESKVNETPINEQAQANALGALWTVFHQEPWWAGGFLWKWFPEMQGHEGYPERDYSPQGKIGADTLKKWHSTYCHQN
jgi:hypothetical protein